MVKLLRALFFIYALFITLDKAGAQAPVANFSANITTSCAPAVITFTDLSTGSPTGWSWNLGNSTTAVNQNPTTAYINPGTYTVVLTVSNAFGSNTKTVVNYITIVPAPTVAFTATDTTISCVPKSVQFVNTSTGNSPGTTTYSWDFGDGFTSTQASPLHVYTVAGTYNVSLVVTNSAGCSDLLNRTQYIRVAPRPVAGFTGTNTNSCTAPITATFTNSSSGAVSYQWDFGDGGTSTATSPTHTYATSGSFTVKLIATNSDGCSDTLVRTAYANIGTLAVGFTSSVTTTCTNTPITFTNTTTPGITTNLWDFGDGGTSMITNPVHSYATFGTYTVKLVVDNGGCIDSINHTISVTQGPDLHFTASNNLGCSLPQTVTFNNTSTGAATYLWLFGDGGTSTATSPSHTYTAAGQYTITLVGISANGCRDTLVMPNLVQIYPITGSIGGVLNFPGCAPATIAASANISSAVPITSYNWDFGDGNFGTGTVVSHTYTAPGSYNLSLSVTTSAGCTFAFNVPVTVGTHSTPSFTATPTSICLGQSVSFTNTTTPSAGSYAWYFGDGGTSTLTNPVYLYGNIGTFSPLLISNNNGCIDSVRIPNLITVAPPLADFIGTVSCTDHRTVTFTNNSVGATTYAWDFGDGSPIYTGANPPPHLYPPAPGTYTISLTVTNGGICTHTASQTIYIFNLTANFIASPTSVCSGTPITFTATSSPHYSSYKWYFGDGNSVITTTNTVTYLYPLTGIYTPSLVVTDRYNCKDSLAKLSYISVNGINPAFTANIVQGCSPVAVTFTDQSTTTSPIASRTWNFGDGNIITTTASTIIHTYLNPGIYTVTLNLVDIAGCTNSLIKPNYIVITRPVSAFTSNDTNFCLGHTATFTSNSTGVGPLTYYWLFGDGGFSAAANPTHLYAGIGNYTVRLITTDANGCKDTLVRTNYVKVSSVTAFFTMSDSISSCPPLSVNFTNTSTPGVSYYWDFGNGGTSTSYNPSNSFTIPGTYTVRLIVTNATGCIDSFKRTVHVNSGASGSFTYAPLTGCFPLTVTFTAVATNATSYIFDFNNGTTLTSPTNTYTYTYTQPGFYVPVLVLSSGPGCFTSIAGGDTIKINQVHAGFTASPNPVCAGGTVNFNDTSSVVGGVITSHNWLFGDGNFGTGANPSHTYPTAGTYVVRLISGTATGCQDTAFRTVVINPNPSVAVSNQTICIGSSIPLPATGAASYTWTPSSTLSCNNCATPIANPTITTTYTIVGTSSFGCTSTTTATVTVNPVPASLSAGANQSICSGATASLLATGANTYNWTANPTLSCLGCNNPVASPITTTTYTVTGTTAAGCSASANVTITVLPLPAITTNNKTHCLGSSDTLSASGGVSYVWSPATGLSCTACTTPVATPATTTTYTVTGTGANGCTNTAQSIVTVNPIPLISIAGANSVCQGFGTTLTASGAATYTWSPITGLSCSACASPTATPATTTTYTVTGTSSLGCIGSTNITVTVKPLPNVSAGSDQTTCLGTPVPLAATGAGSYIWSPASGLSCTTCPNPVANPTATTTYTVTGTDAVGCADTGVVKVTIKPLPTVVATPDTSICKSGSIQLNVTGANTYSWSPSTSLTCSTCINPVASPAATTTYTVTGTDTSGCVNTDNVTVSIYAAPPINAGPDQTICFGKTAQLQASGGNTYTWSPGSTLSCTNCSNPVATPPTSSNYKVIGTDIHGCSDSDYVDITVILKDSTGIGENGEICEGESFQLTAYGGTSYNWTPASSLNNSTIHNPIATPTQTTTYRLILQQGICFTDTLFATVTVHPIPVINAGPDRNITAGSSTTLQTTGSNIQTYRWSPYDGLSCTDCPAPLASPVKTTTYTVNVESDFGCIASDDVTVFITCEGKQLWLPNTFTPNGDGENDRFYPHGKGISSVMRFRIYDRWGELIYDRSNIPTDDANYGWDGTFKGQQLKPDVYVYYINAKCTTGESLEVKGDISLIR